MLEIQGLSAGYGGVQILRDVTLTVHAGEIATLVGSNGAGKSTLLNTVCGIIRPRSGHVLLEGDHRDRVGRLERGEPLVRVHGEPGHRGATGDRRRRRRGAVALRTDRRGRMHVRVAVVAPLDAQATVSARSPEPLRPRQELGKWTHVSRRD